MCIGYGVTDKEFFSLSNSKINELLDASDVFYDFVSKYNVEKELELTRCLNDDSVSVETMDVEDEYINNGRSGNLTPNSVRASILPEQIVVGQFDEN